MYEKDGEKYFIVDGHIHFWDGSPENQANRYGEGFIACFFDYHNSLSPDEYKWPQEQFEKYSEERLLEDLFTDGYVDRAILQPTYLTDFFTNGFNTTERVSELAGRHPDQLIANGAWDPRDGERGLEILEEKHERYGFKGVKLYTAEWRGTSKGYKLTDTWAVRYLEKTQELGIKNVHIHKGPTIWPLNKDAFNVDDVDEAASAFPELNFIVEHVGLPRLEDFCWIAKQEPNVYGGLAVALPFIHTRPKYFAQIIGELVYWLGDHRILFGSDYAIWRPQWLVEQFVDFEMPEEVLSDYDVLTPDMKRNILGLNAARLYDIEVPSDIPQPSTDTGHDASRKPAVAVAP